MARRVRSFNRGPRRATDWSASAVQAASLPVAAASAVIDEILVPPIGGETLVRTRGVIAWASDQVAASENQFGAYGICVVTEQAATIGITAVPHPATDAAWGGWVVHQYFASQVIGPALLGLEPGVMHLLQIDSKGMRKIGENERLVTVWENTGSAHAFNTFASFRFLTKIH